MEAQTEPWYSQKRFLALWVIGAACVFVSIVADGGNIRMSLGYLLLMLIRGALAGFLLWCIAFGICIGIKRIYALFKDTSEKRECDKYRQLPNTPTHGGNGTIACPNCGNQTRVPVETFSTFRCGQCQTRIQLRPHK